MNELIASADRLQTSAAEFRNASFQKALRALNEAAYKIGNAWSGSNIGYQSCVYYLDFESPPPGAHFSSEWGLDDAIGMGSRGDWREFSFEGVRALVVDQAGNPDLTEAQAASDRIAALANEEKGTLVSTLSIEIQKSGDPFLDGLKKKAEALDVLSASQLAQSLLPNQARSRDAMAMHQGLRLAPHQDVMCEVAALGSPALAAEELGKIARQAGSHIERANRVSAQSELIGTNVFIGHGRSAAWRELKDFVGERLRLPYDEFNRVPVAGVTNVARLAQMLDAAAVAFVILTAEDEQTDGSVRARMNVIHEVGLFQGRLGFTKAIVLLEEGCDEFSNIQGLGQIRFPKARISAVFEDVRQVLEREGLIEG